jgi:hypothetical protein
MSTLKVKSETDLAKMGLQVDPVKNEARPIRQGVVWDMSLEEFNTFAAGFTGEQIADKIKEALDQGLSSLKRGAQWYYTAGRWLNFIKTNKLYPQDGWEAFCQTVRLSPSQAWKYRTFAQRFTPQDVKDFGAERFSLEGALGYQVQPEPTSEPTLEPKAVPTTGTHPESVPAPVTRKKRTTNAVTNVPEEEENEDEPEEEEEEQTGPSVTDRTFTEDSKVSVVLTSPGAFELCLEDSQASFLFQLKRKTIHEIMDECLKALEADNGCQPDPLPGQSV